MKRVAVALKELCKVNRNNFPRCFSRQASTENLVLTEIDSSTGIAVLTMNRKPVNSINLEMMTAIPESIASVENDCKGIILTSNAKNVFTAGFDLTFLYGPSREDLTKFWYNLQQILVNMHGSSRPIIAAINGNSPAGGCAISMFADRRIMAEGKFTIGLNEPQFGLQPPYWFMDTMIDIIGRAQTNRALQLGYMFPAAEALQVGLVDKLVPQGQLIQAAKQEVMQWIKIPDEARRGVKKMVRQEYLEKFIADRDRDCKFMVDYLLSEPIQRRLGDYLQAVKNQAKQKA